VSAEVHGAESVAQRALMFAQLARFARPALVNGTAGLVTIVEGQPYAVMGFTIAGGKIVEINLLADPERLRHLDLALLSE
jgi:hypothetical protein